MYKKLPVIKAIFDPIFLEEFEKCITLKPIMLLSF